MDNKDLVVLVSKGSVNKDSASLDMVDLVNKASVSKASVSKASVNKDLDSLDMGNRLSVAMLNLATEDSVVSHKLNHNWTASIHNNRSEAFQPNHRMHRFLNNRTAVSPNNLTAPMAQLASRKQALFLNTVAFLKQVPFPKQVASLRQVPFLSTVASRKQAPFPKQVAFLRWVMPNLEGIQVVPAVWRSCVVLFLNKNKKQWLPYKWKRERVDIFLFESFDYF